MPDPDPNPDPDPEPDPDPNPDPAPPLSAIDLRPRSGFWEQHVGVFA